MRTFKTETDREFRWIEFLDYYKMDLKEFYGKACNRSFYTLSKIALGKRQVNWQHFSRQLF